jgi:hypothetical protein
MHQVAMELPLANQVPNIIDCPAADQPVPVESKMQIDEKHSVPDGYLKARIAE